MEATAEFYGIWNPASGPVCISDVSILGYPAADQAGYQHLLKLIHPDDRHIFASWLARCLADTKRSCEIRLRKKGGNYNWFEIRGKAIRTGGHGTASNIAYAGYDIHSAKLEREKILDSYKHLSAIAEASQECTCILDPTDFRLLVFNEAYAHFIFKLRGIHVAPGMNAEDIEGPEEAATLIEFIRRVLAEGIVSEDRYFPSLDVTHSITARCLVRDGRVCGIAFSANDISARKQIEKALRKSEEKFSATFRSAPMPLSITSIPDSRYIEANEAYCEMTGYTRKELIGRTPYDIGLWVNPTYRKELVQELSVKGTLRNREFQLRTKSGEVRDIVGSATLISDIDGEPCMLVVNSDITERKRIVQALRESEERLRDAVEAGNMHTFEWNLSTDICHGAGYGLPIRASSESDSTYTKKELIVRIHPEDRENVLKAFTSLSPDMPRYKTSFRLQGPDGRTVWLEESGKGTFGPDGKLLKVLGIDANVTDVRRSEHDLRELSKQLINSLEEERRRVARELHDQIGQEAALICTQAQRIESGTADKEQTTHSDVHELYGRIKALAADVSKLSHRLHSSELTFLGLGVAAERLCRDFASQHAVDLDFHPKPLPPHLDSAKALNFYRVLQEALQNVAKHSHATRVTVELGALNNEIYLDVTDNGTGFDPDKDASDSGLGLLSMRERLNLIGGRCVVSSVKGSGTKVRATAAI